MILLERIGAVVVLSLFLAIGAQAQATFVASQQEFNTAHSNASSGDSIVWRSGTYSNIFMNIFRSDISVTAEELGATIFTGNSRVELLGDDLLFEGFQFLDGNIGNDDVINVRGSNITITQINIRAYRSYKYLRVREESQFVDITFCNFENRLNLDDQNILSILVDDNNPGFHKIQFCSFKNFAGSGNDLGIEPIRIGVSSQADYISRSLVEYCYFTNCNGDGELISSKARQNVYRFNTFENNPLAELVLRHGSENIVYGNFFLSGKGGVRVREGQDQYIYNNYFYDLGDRPIILQNENSDPLDNIHIAFNTIINCDEMRLGGDGGNNDPTRVVISNNIFTDPKDDLFRDETGLESWIGNIYLGSLGIPVPTNGLIEADPELVENTEGFFGLSETSPAIDAAEDGYAFLPQFDGIDDIDSEVLFDLMGQNRPALLEERDLGSNEFPHDITIQPFATEDNTGPSYETSPPSSVEDERLTASVIAITPNPVSNVLMITISN